MTGVLVPDHLLLPIIRHQQSTGVVLRSPVQRQPHVVPANNLIRRLLLVPQPVNLLDPERGEGQRRTLDCADGTDREICDDLVVLNFVDGVVFPQAAEDERFEVAGHHVQSVGHLAVDRRRRVVQIAVEKAPYYSLCLHICGGGIASRRRERQPASMSGSWSAADNRCFTLAVYPDHGRRLQAYVDCEREGG